MKRLLFTLGCLAAMHLAVAGEENRLFEMRTYHAASGRLDAMLEQMQASVPLFEKHGITIIGCWLPLNAQGQAEGRVTCILAYPDRQTRDALWKTLVSDPDWRALHRPASNGRLVARIENVFLRPTNYSPELKPSSVEGNPRLFELRTYTAAPNRLEALHQRFRNHTLDLFARHGMTHIGYWTPTDKDKGAGDTLIFLLAHSSSRAAAESFNAFREDPEWIEARKTSEVDGPLTTHVGSVFMRPADFSPIR